MQNCAIFRNRRKVQRGAYNNRAGSGIKGYGKREGHHCTEDNTRNHFQKSCLLLAVRKKKQI